MLKWSKSQSKSMSGSYSMKGTPAGGVSMKKGSLATNGNGPPPLSYPADPPDDENMNEIIDENVDLTVVLPDGSRKQQSIEPNIPMMDLLINLAASNRLNPASHTLVVLTGDKWKQIDFKANKTIGALAGPDGQVSVQIVKKIKEEKVKTKSTAQPFEMTYRFTVNLPHHQKKVLRISPKQTLGEVRQTICKEKNYDASRYVFLLPGNPSDPVDDITSVGDLKTSEINFVAISMIEAASSKSMPDLAFAAARAGTEGSTGRTRDDSAPYMPSAGEKKAKRGFLSFLGKKDNNKFKPKTDMEIEVSQRPRKSESFNAGAYMTGDVRSRPQTMYAESPEADHYGIRRTKDDSKKYSQDFRKSTSALQTVSETGVVKTAPVKNDNAPPKKSGKKRAAPPPPQAKQNAQKPQTVQVEINVQNKAQDQTKIEDMPEARVPLKKIHSRNSSDSSGYHELTMSSADSPDANKTDNLQTTLDTTSIDSAEHFNGDSGIRDMSPVRRRSANRAMHGAGSRESSLDLDKPIAAGRKKKRAPLPPPGMSAAPVDTNSPRKVLPASPKRCEARVQEEEFSALQAMEEVTMKFDIAESDDDDLQMVETSSVHSEDVDVTNHRQRPAMFIPPPPPNEPPPDDSPQVNINMVNTVDIGVGDSTTNSAPTSAKNSPLSTERSRHGSQSSYSSVNTIEDLSLAFHQTIALGQESLGVDSDDDRCDDRFDDHDDQFADDDDDDGSVQDELQKAMPEFRKHITRLTLDDNEGGSTSSPSPESNKETENAAGVDSMDASRNSVGRLREEITYEFTVDEVPADFQNAPESDRDSEDYEREEIVEYFQAQPTVLEIGSPHKIPDLDSPKEHRSLSLPEEPEEVIETVEEVQVVAREVVPEKKPEKEEFVISLDELSNVDFSAMKPGEQPKPRRELDAPKVNYRIEFRSSINSMDDNEYVEEEEVVQALPAKIVSQAPVCYEDENYGDPDVDTGDNSQMYDNGVKSMCSELSFTPRTEGEAEHVLEEKSISMIALPAERTPVKNMPAEDQNGNLPAETFASSTQIVLTPSNSGLNMSPSVSSSNTPSSNVSPRRDDSFESSNLMQAQYQQLQQQFMVWQSQLMQNQKLLANSTGADPSSTNQTPGMEDQSSLQLQQLQLQIQMQQQMMFQLQQSMQTLALQNTFTAPQMKPMAHSFSMPVEPIQTSTPIPQPPPAPIAKSTSEPTFSAVPEPPKAPELPKAQVATSKPKPSKADAKYTKPKQKRFERQLDPREQLMLDIKSIGKTNLKKVPVKATHWHK